MRFERFLEKLIFASRWLQAPLYLGLIFGMVLFLFNFYKEIIHLFEAVNEGHKNQLLIAVLEMVDSTMVASLVIMVVIGGYSTFVSKMNLENHEDRPEWLQKINAGTLKVKLAASLVGVSGVNLLIDFFNVNNQNYEQTKWRVIIHFTFLLSVLILAFSEKLLDKK
ncbi:MAG: TIGR00645 family protein [Bacteroidetes bacterium]|nr:TIGR00645 family protein [Bacteroidota bacterium]